MLKLTRDVTRYYADAAVFASAMLGLSQVALTILDTEKMSKILDFSQKDEERIEFARKANTAATYIIGGTGIVLMVTTLALNDLIEE